MTSAHADSSSQAPTPKDSDNEDLRALLPSTAAARRRVSAALLRQVVAQAREF